MKKIRIIAIVFVTMLLLVLSSCNKEQEKVTVTYIIDDEVYEVCELLIGEKASNIEAEKKDNLVFTGWKLRNEEYDFSKPVTKDIKLKGSFITFCEANGHTVVTDSKIDATCAETGLTEGSHCSVCNEVLKEQYPISKSIVHNYSEPTCLTPATCTVCGKQKNDKLGEHKVVEANYEEGSHCSVCNEIYGDKLLYEVVDLEYEINSEREMLTIDEYNNIIDILVVYGVLNDGTKVKLNNEEVEVYYERIKVDENAYPIKYIPLVYLKYNNYVKQTNKLYYGILNILNIDFTNIDSAGMHRLIVGDECGDILISREYFTILGVQYTEQAIEYFKNNGWEYFSYVYPSTLGYQVSRYFLKDGYKLVFDFREIYNGVEPEIYMYIRISKVEDFNKIVYLDYKFDFNNKYLTINQYKYIKAYLTVYAIYLDGRKEEVSNADVTVYNLDFLADKNSAGPHIHIEYQDILIQTDKLYYGMINELEIDYDKLSPSSNIYIREDYSTVYYDKTQLLNYIAEMGYESYDEYFKSCGWVFIKGNETTSTASYYIRNNVKMYITVYNEYINIRVHLITE